LPSDADSIGYLKGVVAHLMPGRSTVDELAPAR
jgi:hypothetical protein